MSTKKQTLIPEKQPSPIPYRTSSGKLIYDVFDHPSHKKFTAQDHIDASDSCDKISIRTKYGKNQNAALAKKFRDQANAHLKAYEQLKKTEKMTEKFNPKKEK